jgi:hypothetical protein
MDQRDQSPRTAVLDRPAPSSSRAPSRTPEPASTAGARRQQGLRDIVGGAVLIGVGFLFGGSVFQGNPTLLDWVFDGLGTFWIAKGIYFVATANSAGSV